MLPDNLDYFLVAHFEKLYVAASNFCRPWRLGPHLGRFILFNFIFITLKRPWQATVRFNNLLYFLHQADCLGDSGEDLLVVGKVVGRKPPALTVLEPLRADLVAADMEVPHGFRHAAEADACNLRRWLSPTRFRFLPENWPICSSSEANLAAAGP